MWRRSVIVLLRTAAVVAAWFSFDYLCVEPFRGNVVLREVADRLFMSESRDTKQAAILARRNLHDLERVARGRRLDPSWYLLYGGNCEVLQRWTDATEAYTRALRIDDRPEIYFHRGLVLFRLGRMDAAIADMVKAVRFNPNMLSGIDGELRARVAAAAGLQ